MATDRGFIEPCRRIRWFCCFQAMQRRRQRMRIIRFMRIGISFT